MGSSIDQLNGFLFVGRCLRRGLYFLNEWALDALEQEEHRPVSNKNLFEMVASYRQEHRRQWQGERQRDGSHLSDELISLSWAELDEPEAVGAVSSSKAPTIVWAKSRWEDAADNEAINLCHHRLSPVLRNFTPVVCGLNSTILCAHAGHEIVQLKRHFPVSSARYVLVTVGPCHSVISLPPLSWVIVPCAGSTYHLPYFDRRSVFPDLLTKAPTECS